MKELDEWITGDELLERWKMGKPELLRKVQSGLPAYKPCDSLETLIIKDKFSRIGIDTTAFVFKPDYTDKNGNHFRLVYLEYPEGINEIPSGYSRRHRIVGK